MALKRTAIFLDPQDHRALFRLSLQESHKEGRRVTMAEVIRQAVKAYLKTQRAAPRVRRKRRTGYAK